MTTVLVTGGTGMLGHYVVELLRGADITVHSPGRAACDLEDAKALYGLVADLKPDAVLHLGAKTDVDACERDPTAAATTNYLATQSIAHACADVKIWLLYVSTGSVFGKDDKLVHNELDIPSPISYYAKSKLWGEWAVREICGGRSAIVRAGWMIGGGPQRDKKFVGRLISQIRTGARELTVVNDKYGSLTPASSLASCILAMMKAEQTGLFHIASQGTITRYDVAECVATALCFDGKLKAVSSSLFPQSAPRPTSEAIASLYSPLADDRPGDWRDDLLKYVAEFETTPLA